MARPTQVNDEIASWRRTSHRWAATAIVLTMSWCIAAAVVWRWDGQGVMGLSFENVLLAADSGVNEDVAIERLRAMTVLSIRKLREKCSSDDRTGMAARLAMAHIQVEVEK